MDTLKEHLGPISLTDLSVFWGLNLTLSDSRLSLPVYKTLNPQFSSLRTFFGALRQQRDISHYCCLCTLNEASFCQPISTETLILSLFMYLLI